MKRRRPPERCALVVGTALTASGVAHLLRPQAFDWINQLAFEDNIRTHVLVNGSIETGLGLALLAPRTRRATYAAAAIYLTYFNIGLLRKRASRVDSMRISERSTEPGVRSAW